MSDYYKLSPHVKELSREALDACGPAFEKIDQTCEENSVKVLEGFSRHRISEAHLTGSSGYGYGDRGRNSLDALFATVFRTEDALVRHHFPCGTAAIVTALFALLRPGDAMVSLTGRPYDTLHAALGLTGETDIGSFPEFGIAYRELPLLENGRVNLDDIADAVKDAKIAYLQRSRGYSLRPSLLTEDIEKIALLVREANPKAYIVVDNCYGEFAETREPAECGADLIIGSLIKNPGGGIARTGGYIAGKKELVERCAHRMTAPGLGREVGCSLSENKNMYMGLFYAPGVVASALKTAVFAASLFSLMGYEVTPEVNEKRADIIQAVVTKSPERLSAFCRGIQRGAPVDSFVRPEAWDMPGYSSQVIMAAGAFNLGASIELSADGPMREPYAAWLQGGLNFPTGKLGVMMAAQEILDI